MMSLRYYAAMASIWTCLASVGIASAWGHGPLTAILGSDHPARVVICVLLVLGFGSLCDFGQQTPHRTAIWLTAIGGAWVTLVAMLCYVFGVWLARGTWGELDVAAIVLFGALFALLVVRTFRLGSQRASAEPAEHEAPEALPAADAGVQEDVAVVGKMASFIVMILALYAFGLRIGEGTSESHGALSVHWAEVPAILVVFVLAELGVELVLRSQRVSREVSGAARAASTAAERAEAAVRTANKSVADANEGAERIGAQVSSVLAKSEAVSATVNTQAQALEETQQRLSTLLQRVTPMVEGEIYQSAFKLASHVAMPQSEFWQQMKVFTDSWNPDAGAADDKTRQLLGVLFSSYIGRETRDGSVRHTDASISCITADAVFAEASEKWLEKMREVCRQDQQLVVWAVSRLLPTEFAFPGLWLGSPAGEEKPSRVKALERFICSVMRACRDQESPVEYRRVTVVDPTQKSRFERLAKREFAERSATALPAADVGSLLANSLDNWMVWDPRLEEAEWHKRGEFVQLQTGALLDSVIARVPGSGGIAPLAAFEWRTIESLFKADWNAEEGAGQNARMMPIVVGGPGRPSAYLFSDRFADCGCAQCAEKNLHPERIAGCILGIDAGLLMAEVDTRALAASRSLEAAIMRRLDPGETNATVRDLLNRLGWRSIREWYCHGLHGKDRARSQAAVAIVSDLKLLSPLKLDWNGSSVLTLDLLLIGTRPRLADVKEAESGPSWHGAAISNLSLDRTECTVQLVTRQDRLQNIAEVVRLLFDGGHQDISSGSWEEFAAAPQDKVLAAS